MRTTDSECLQCLLNDLATSGFQITLEQRIRAMGLFLNLSLSDFMPLERNRLGNMLGALLCRSADEQHNFRHIFSQIPPAKPEA